MSNQPQSSPNFSTNNTQTSAPITSLPTITMLRPRPLPLAPSRHSTIYSGTSYSTFLHSFYSESSNSAEPWDNSANSIQENKQKVMNAGLGDRTTIESRNVDGRFKVQAWMFSNPEEMSFEELLNTLEEYANMERAIVLQEQDAAEGEMTEIMSPQTCVTLQGQVFDELCNVEEDNGSISTVFIPQFQALNESHGGELVGQNCEGKEGEKGSDEENNADVIKGIAARQNIP